MNSLPDFGSLRLKEEEPRCIGKVYKADVQHCKTKRGFMLSIRLNEMKKLSCKGCGDRCRHGWEDESLCEISEEWSVVDIEKVEHGKLYKVDICNESSDWETGTVDDWDLKLVEVDPASLLAKKEDDSK